jgi:hypothetical protein
VKAGRSRREVAPEQWEAESDLDRLEERFG